MMETEPKPKRKEVVIVIDDPRTGRAHLEFPDPEATVPGGGVTPVPEPGVRGRTSALPRRWTAYRPP